MFIKINYLLIWWTIAFIISLIVTWWGNESLMEFVGRFSFSAFLNTVVFLILSYFKII